MILTLPRRPDWRGIKSHRSYTVEEAARGIGVAKGTVRRWIKQGLPSITDKKPALVLGADLIEFHRLQKKPKQSCLPHECYCVKCRKPRSPAGGMAEYVPLTATSGNLRAICPDCLKLMYRRVANRNVSTILRQPSVEFKLGCLAFSAVD
jgi:hypothetical protein